MQGRQSTRHSRGPSVGITLCAVLLAAASAAAQSAAQPAADTQAATRSAQLAAEREALAAKATPPTRSFVERTLSWYDNQSVLSRIFAGWHGLHIVSGRFPAGAGTAAGVGYTLGGDEGLWFNAEAATSTRGYKRAGASLAFRQLGGAPVDLSVHGGAYEYPQEDFFGLGVNSRRENRSNYQLSGAEGGADMLWRPGGGVEVDGGVWYLSPRVDSGTDHRMPSTETLFDPATLPGYLAQTDYVRTSLSVALDRRDNPAHAHAGGRFSARLSDYRDRDSAGSNDFRMAELEVAAVHPASESLPGAGAARRRRLHRRRHRVRRAVLLAADAGRRPGTSRVSRVPLPGPQQRAGVRRVPMGSVVGARRRALRRRRHGGPARARPVNSATSTSPTASASGSTATAPSSRASTWHSAAKASFPF